MEAARAARDAAARELARLEAAAAAAELAQLETEAAEAAAAEEAGRRADAPRDEGAGPAEPPAVDEPKGAQHLIALDESSSSSEEPSGPQVRLRSVGSVAGRKSSSTRPGTAPRRAREDSGTPASPGGHGGAKLFGTVVTWAEGRSFGFLKPDLGGPEVFVHKDNVVAGPVRRGDWRSYRKAWRARKGKDQAVDVQFMASPNSGAAPSGSGTRGRDKDKGDGKDRGRDKKKRKEKRDRAGSARADRRAPEEERPWKRQRGPPSATPRARSVSASEQRQEDDSDAERPAGRRSPQFGNDEEARRAGRRGSRDRSGRSVSPSGSSPPTTRIPAAGARGTVVSVTGRKMGTSARYIIIVSVGGGEGVPGGTTLNLRPVRSPVWHESWGARGAPSLPEAGATVTFVATENTAYTSEGAIEWIYRGKKLQTAVRVPMPPPPKPTPELSRWGTLA